MSSAQWRVFTILLITAGLEALFSPLTGSMLHNIATGKGFGVVDPNKPVADQLAAPATAAIAFVIGVALLLWLADGVPALATAIAVLILVLVILRYGSEIGNFLTIAGSATGSKQ